MYSSTNGLLHTDFISLEALNLACVHSSVSWRDSRPKNHCKERAILIILVLKSSFCTKKQLLLMFYSFIMSLILAY